MWKHGIQQSKQGLRSNTSCQEHEPHRITTNLLHSSDTTSSPSVYSVLLFNLVFRNDSKSGDSTASVPENKENETDTFTAYLEICVLLQVLYLAVYIQQGIKKGNLKGLTPASLCDSWFISEALCSCQSQAQVIYNSLKFQYKNHIAAGRHVSFSYIACHFLGNIIIKMSGITASARNIFRFQPISRNFKFKERIIKYCMTN